MMLCGYGSPHVNVWITLTQGKVEFLEENNVDQVCYYLFNIVGRAVCGYQLSPGDIICIM